MIHSNVCARIRQITQLSVFKAKIGLGFAHVCRGGAAHPDSQENSEKGIK